MKIKKILINIAMAKADIRTYTELSQKTGISRTTLNRYLTPEGFEKITMKNLSILCDTLHCKIEDLAEIEYEEGGSSDRQR